MRAEQQLARARAALRVGDRVRARQLLGSLLRQDPTMVEGWVLLSRSMSTRAASQWCLQCAAKFISIDEVDPSSASAHLEGAGGGLVRSGEVEAARPARDHQSAPPIPRQPSPIERPFQTSSRLAEAWRALDSDYTEEDSEFRSVSRTLEYRQQSTKRAGAERSHRTERHRPSIGGEARRAHLSAPDSHEEDTKRGSAQDQTPAADDPRTSAPVPRADSRETDDHSPANPAPGLRTSSTAWRAVYLEPTGAFLEEEQTDVSGRPPADEEPARPLAGLSRLAVRTTQALVGKLRRAEPRVRSVAQLLLFGLGALLLCNGVSLLYPRVVPTLRRNPWLAEAAPALESQGETKPLTSKITKDLAPSTSPTSLGWTLRRESDPLTAETANPASPAVGQNADPAPDPQEPEPLRPWLSFSDLPETRSKPDVTVKQAVPSRLTIPALGLDAPVVPVTSTTRAIQGRQVRSWDVPGNGAVGWHSDSSPLGVIGNTVLNGHNTTGGEVFRDLHRLQHGDEVIVFAGNEQHTYTVVTTTILREAGVPLERRLEHAQLLTETGDRRLTLVTCHPYGSTVNRLVVTCFPREDRAARGNLKP